MVDFNEEQSEILLGGETPVFLKFYSPTCGHCQKMAPAFEEASEMFHSVTFAGLNCQTYHKVCEKYEIRGYPTIKLFPAKSILPVDYEGERYADAFADFITEKIKIQPKRPPTYVTYLKPLTYSKHINKEECTFVTFFDKSSRKSFEFMNVVKQIAFAFFSEKNMSIAAVDCEIYSNLCNQQKFSSDFPKSLFYSSSAILEYTGHATEEAVADFLNEHCGTERGADGLLINSSGLVKEATEVIREFAFSDSKLEVVEKMKTVEGAAFYVKVLERVVANGEASLSVDIGKMENILAARQSSLASLDSLKKRLNIFHHVVDVLSDPEKFLIEDLAPDAKPQEEYL